MLNTDIYAFPTSNSVERAELYSNADRAAAINAHGQPTEMGLTWILTEEEAAYLSGDPEIIHEIYSSGDKAALRHSADDYWGYAHVIGEGIGEPRSTFARLQDTLINNGSSILSKLFGSTLGCVIPGLEVDIDVNTGSRKNDPYGATGGKNRLVDPDLNSSDAKEHGLETIIISAVAGMFVLIAAKKLI